MKSFGEAYLDHFYRHFGAPIGREVFESPLQNRSIQILEFKDVFAGCRVFCTIGLSHYSNELGGVFEVVSAVDEGGDALAGILANALFFAVMTQQKFGHGISIAGIKRISPAFAEQYAKDALYFTNPIGLPEGFSCFTTEAGEARVLLAILISHPEFEYFQDNGADNFEALMEQNDVDPFHLVRPSIK